MKLYTYRPDHFFFMISKTVATLSNTEVETVVVSQEVQDSPDFKTKIRQHGQFPMLQLADGTMIYESMAIAQYFARTSAEAGNLLGNTAFEQAQVQQWIFIAATGVFPQAVKIAQNTFGFNYDATVYADASKLIKEQVKIINTHLDGKEYLVGGRLTVADVSLFSSLVIPFSFILDGGFRKAMPHAAAWFLRVSQNKAVVSTFGHVKMCEKLLKPVDITKLTPVAAPVKVEAKQEEPKKEEPKKEEKKADEDDFDPFADDEPEDEEAEKARMERMKALAKPAKQGLIAKSIIIWEVKPWGEETDLDALGAKILAITMDGLQWKTEFKKEPIAYGVQKIVIGAVVEDEKVSTDLVEEAIMAFEDDVQSVDIQSFNKL